MLLLFLSIKNLCLTEEYVHTDSGIQNTENSKDRVNSKASCTSVISKLLPVPIPFAVKLNFMAQICLNWLRFQGKNECSCCYFMSQIVLVNLHVPGTAERKSLPYLALCSKKHRVMAD